METPKYIWWAVSKESYPTGGMLSVLDCSWFFLCQFLELHWFKIVLESSKLWLMHHQQQHYFHPRSKKGYVCIIGLWVRTFSFFYVVNETKTKHGFNLGLWLSRWWFQIFFIFIPILGNDPIWRAYFSDGWFNHQPLVFLWATKLRKANAVEDP